MLKRQNSVADSSFCAADTDAIRCFSFLLNKNHTDIAHKVKKIYICMLLSVLDRFKILVARPTRKYFVCKHWFL